MYTVRLTERDYATLVMMLGFAGAAWTKQEPLPQSWKEVTDWIVIQGFPTNYTYWHDKEELRKKKEGELCSG